MTSSKAEMLNILIEFFLENFDEDPIGVAEWVEQRGLDTDKFLEDVESLRKMSNK